MALIGASSGQATWNAGLVTQPPRVVSGGALVPALVAHGEAWRLVSSMFLHAGFVHLALNMFSLYILGTFVEVAFGRERYLALYLLSGLAGGVAYLYFGAYDAPVVGASGAIFGLLGGVFGYALRRGTFSWQNPVIRQLLILLFINLAFGFSVHNVSNTSHLGGIAGGLVFGFLIAPSVRSGKSLSFLSTVALVLGIEALLLGTWLFY